MEALRNKRGSPIIALYFLISAVNEKAIKASYLCFYFGQLARYMLVVFLAFNYKKVSKKEIYLAS